MNKKNFIKKKLLMKIKLISFILLLFVGVFTYAYEYLEIATIPGTAVLNFQ